MDIIIKIGLGIIIYLLFVNPILLKIAERLAYGKPRKGF